MIQLSILIVSYNVKSLLERCLRSLERIPSDWEVIVVDNNSKDGSQALLEKFKVQSSPPKADLMPEAHPSFGVTPLTEKFKVILLDKNLGFARGNIEALKQAKGEYILLLNPDTKVLPGAIEKMVEYLDQHSDVWIVGPKLLNEDGSIQRSVRGFPTLSSQVLVLLKLHNYLCKSSSVTPDLIGDPENKNKQKQNPAFSFFFSFLDSRLCGNDKGESGKNDKWCLKSLERYFLANFDYSTTQEVDQVMGAALMTRRSVIEKIGFLDPGFKRIFEEVDFCFRVKQVGGKVCYFPEARIVHSRGQSFGQSLSLMNMLKKQYYFNQGMTRFFWKHKSIWHPIILFPFIKLSIVVTTLLWFLLKLKIHLAKNREY